MSRLLVLISVLSVNNIVVAVWPRPQVHVKYDKYYVLNKNETVRVEVVNHKCDILSNALKHFNYEIVFRNPKLSLKANAKLTANSIQLTKTNSSKRVKRELAISDEYKPAILLESRYEDMRQLWGENSLKPRVNPSIEYWLPKDASLEENSTDLFHKKFMKIIDKLPTKRKHKLWNKSSIKRDAISSNEIWINAMIEDEMTTETPVLNTTTNQTLSQISSVGNGTNSTKDVNEHAVSDRTITNSSEFWSESHSPEASPIGKDYAVKMADGGGEDISKDEDMGNSEKSIEWKLRHPDDPQMQISLELLLANPDELVNITQKLDKLAERNSSKRSLDILQAINSSENAMVHIIKKKQEKVLKDSLPITTTVSWETEWQSKNLSDDDWLKNSPEQEVNTSYEALLDNLVTESLKIKDLEIKNKALEIKNKEWIKNLPEKIKDSNELWKDIIYERPANSNENWMEASIEQKPKSGNGTQNLNEHNANTSNELRKEILYDQPLRLSANKKLSKNTTENRMNKFIELPSSTSNELLGNENLNRRLDSYKELINSSENMMEKSSEWLTEKNYSRKRSASLFSEERYLADNKTWLEESSQSLTLESTTAQQLLNSTEWLANTDRQSTRMLDVSASSTTIASTVKEITLGRTSSFTEKILPVTNSVYLTAEDKKLYEPLEGTRNPWTKNPNNNKKQRTISTWLVLTNSSTTVKQQAQSTQQPCSTSTQRVTQPITITTTKPVPITANSTEQPPPRKLRVVDSEPFKKLIINLTMSCEEMPYLNMKEHYTLKVYASEAVLTSSSVWGIIRGLFSFAELLYDVDDERRINQTDIKDEPRYPHRGLMLDTAIHYVPVKNIIYTLDAMAMNKMNVFHWHIVDDESFPYVSQKYPSLSEQGAYHKNMTYNKKDIKKIIDHARNLGIRVIPEFTIPGHTRSWGKAYPNLLTKCYSGKEVSRLGPMNPIRDETYAFLGELLKEIHDDFPDHFMYFGGNEIDMTCWNSNPDIVDYIGYFGVKSINELLILFMRNVLPSYPNGTRIIFWEDVFQANVPLPADAVIQLWKKEDWKARLGSVLWANFRSLLTWNLEDDQNTIYDEDPREAANCEKDSLGCMVILGGEAALLGNMVNNKLKLAGIWEKVSQVAELLWSEKPNVLIHDEETHKLQLKTHICNMIRMGLPAKTDTKCQGVRPKCKRRR